MSKQPNIILIMADQVNPVFLPTYGHPVVKMPNLDALAAEGVVFDTAYCNYPICAPSRFSMLTGRLASELKVFDHGCEMPASTPTMMHYLRNLGYHTALSGKMHFLGPDQLHGYEERLTTDIYPSDFGWGPDWSAGTPEVPWAPTGISPRTVIEAGPCARSLQLDFDEETAHQAVQKIYDLARDKASKPFFLTVSFSQPHSPFVAGREYWNRYDPSDIDMPRIGPLSIDEMDAHSKRLHNMFHIGEYTVADENVRNARHAYYGMLSYIDDKIGELMSALEQSMLLENTVVVFTSDHGEMLGERGLWYKQSLLEGSVKVPLIVRMPEGTGDAGRHVKQSVSLIDLLPTFVEIGNYGDPIEYVEPIIGHSLLPLLNSDDADWNHLVFSEYSAEGTYAPCLMIRKGNYKYIYCETDPALLFDIKADPNELNNLATQEDYAEILDSMHAELLNFWDPIQFKTEALKSQKRQRFIHEVQEKTTANLWVFQPTRNAKDQYVRSGANTTAVKGLARLPYVEPAKPDKPRSC